MGRCRSEHSTFPWRPLWHYGAFHKVSSLFSGLSPYLILSSPLCSCALGPTNRSPSSAPAITLQVEDEVEQEVEELEVEVEEEEEQYLLCFGRPI